MAVGGLGVGVTGRRVAVAVGGLRVGVAGRCVGVGGAGVKVGVSVTAGGGGSVAAGVGVSTGVGVSAAVAVNDGFGVLVGVGVTVAAGAIRDIRGQLQLMVAIIAIAIVPRNVRFVLFKSHVLFPWIAGHHLRSRGLSFPL